MKITDLKPAEVFRIFGEICAIPHGSGNTARISAYCAGFAEKLGLPHFSDGAGNVIIRKDGTAGYENSPPVILQGHLDMVCEKTDDCPKNMETEGITPITDGEYVTADSTTLGGDDGIAVAYILSVLAADDIPHPPIEALFTVDEETGMTGARFLDASRLKGKTLINIDSEEEGILTVGCAGGARIKCALPLDYTECAGKSFLKLTVSGLTGGHSGIDIDKHRQNAVRVLARLLSHINRVHSINICSLSGGGKENVIAKRAEAVIACDPQLVNDITGEADTFLRNVKRENRVNEPNLSISYSIAEAAKLCADDASTKKIIFALMHSPDGIREMSPEIAGTVRTSLNMGTVFTDGEKLNMGYLIRSSTAARRQETSYNLISFIEYLGGSAEVLSDYPAWEYKAESPLREIMVSTYKEMYGSEPKIISIHAGLECGILSAKIPEADMVSFGPDIENAHTPDERMNVASVGRCYDYLLRVLKNLK